MARKPPDPTAASFLNAIAKLGPRPDTKSSNAIFSSFANLDPEQQDKVIQSPIYWDCLAKSFTEKDREEWARGKVERLKRDLESVVDGVGTRKTAVAKAAAARLLATVPDCGTLFEWTRAMVCVEVEEGGDFAAGKAGSEGAQ